MKISILIKQFNYQGGGQVVATLGNELQRRGHQLDLFILKSTEADMKTRPRVKFAVIDLNNARAINKFLRQIFRGSKENQSHLLLCIGEIPNIIGGLIRALGAGSCVVGSEHFAKTYMTGLNRFTLRSKLIRQLGLFSYRHLDGLVFVSEALKKSFEKRFPALGAKCQFIQNPAPARAVSSLKENHFKTGAVRIIGVGVLETRKRWDLLLYALATVQLRYAANLTIVGTGSLYERLQALAIQLNIENRVTLYGYHSDVPSYLSEFDILALTSQSEAFGMVLVEGLCAGLQVVSTNCFSGPGEILADGRYGFLAEPGSVDSIAAAIIAAIESPIPKEVVLAGAARYSVEDVGVAYEKYFQSILNNRRLKSG